MTSSISPEAILDGSDGNALAAQTPSLSRPITSTARLRASFRIARVGLHLCSGALIVLCIFPLLRLRWRQRIQQRWARQLLGILGLHLERDFPALPERALIVCNHISWLDIFVIGALMPCGFVCKDEVKSWPLIGWLVSNTGNVFIQRGSHSAASRTLHIIGEHLQRDERVVFFPEGTTTDGTKLLPFTTALFEAANVGDSLLVPMSLRYLEADGSRSAAPAYDGDITFMECMFAVASTPRIKVDLRVLHPLTPGLSRREYAERSRKLIADDLGLE